MHCLQALPTLTLLWFRGPPSFVGTQSARICTLNLCLFKPRKEPLKGISFASRRNSVQALTGLQLFSHPFSPWHSAAHRRRDVHLEDEAPGEHGSELIHPRFWWNCEHSEMVRGCALSEGLLSGVQCGWRNGKGLRGLFVWKRNETTMKQNYQLPPSRSTI